MKHTISAHRDLMYSAKTHLRRDDSNQPWCAVCLGWRNEYLRLPIGPDKAQKQKYFKTHAPMGLYAIWLTTRT